jgi:hypothetical protein
MVSRTRSLLKCLSGKNIRSKKSEVCFFGFPAGCRRYNRPFKAPEAELLAKGIRESCFAQSFRD